MLTDDDDDLRVTDDEVAIAYALCVMRSELRIAGDGRVVWTRRGIG